MDLKDVKNLAGTEEYRLLMLQSDPDNGERICVGVIVGGELLYDPKLSRVRCLSRGLKPDIVRFYLSDFRQRALRGGAEPLERVAREYAPTFVLSPPRRIASPVDEPTKLMLLKRFVEGDAQEMGLEAQDRPRTVAAARVEFTGKLRHLASTIVSPGAGQLIENARPRDIFGESYKGVGVVPVAIRKPDRTVLMDGVDLNMLGPKEAIAATGRVVHTFWQYKIAADRYGENLTRIAVVFNGNRPKSHAFQDAHDFAIHEFAHEAESTVEASSQEGMNQLAGLLN